MRVRGEPPAPSRAQYLLERFGTEDAGAGDFTEPVAPRSVRLERALRYMQELLGEVTPPSNELYELLAERYDVTKEELVRAWIKAGLSREAAKELEG